MPDVEFEAMLACAAEKGAKRADVGLDGEEAALDIRDLRSLVDCIRLVRRTANLDKTSRERVKQASRDLLASIKSRLAELDRFWEKEQTKADVFILDEVFASLPSPPFTPDEKKALAASVYAYVWQQAVNGGFAQAA